MDIWQKLEQKFTSGNSLPVERTTITDEDYEALLDEKRAFKEADNVKRLYEYELKERMRIFSSTLKTMTNGEWDKLKTHDPFLHDFIKQAVNR